MAAVVGGAREGEMRAAAAAGRREGGGDASGGRRERVEDWSPGALDIWRIGSGSWVLPGALPDAAAPCPGCWSRQVYRSREVSRPPLRLA
jgi:hypothetical protein